MTSRWCRHKSMAPDSWPLQSELHGYGRIALGKSQIGEWR
jgi:hypothetical protein